MCHEYNAVKKLFPCSSYFLNKLILSHLCVLLVVFPLLTMSFSAWLLLNLIITHDLYRLLAAKPLLLPLHGGFIPIFTLLTLYLSELTMLLLPVLVCALLLTLTLSISKWIIDLSVKLKTINYWKKILGEDLCDPGLGNSFLDMILKA